MGLFGGDSKKTSTSTTVTQDQRIGVEGNIGSMVGPGAVVAGSGGAAIHAAPGASVTQTISTTGMEPGDVRGLMDSVFENNQATTQTLSSLAGGMKEQAKNLTDIVGQTRVSESSQLIQLLPLILVAAGLLFWRK